MGFEFTDKGDFRQSMASFCPPRPGDHALRRKEDHRTVCTGKRFAWTDTHRGRELISVACGRCRHCRWVRRQSLTSQGEMEWLASDWCLFVTLTIAPGPKRVVPVVADDLHRGLDKTLLVNWQHRVRKNAARRKGSFVGVDCTSWRYMQCGEYGGKKGRAHYHVIVYGRGGKPDWMTNPAYRRRYPVAKRGEEQRLDLPEWGFGHATVQDVPDGGVIFYVSKYMLREDKASWYSQSSGRSLGGDWIERKARALAAQGYSLPTLDFLVEVSDLDGVRDLHRPAKYGTVSQLGLVRNANCRRFILAFAEARGVPVMSMYRHASTMVQSALVVAERWRRERLLKESIGYLPLLAADAIKLDVINEANAIAGRPMWLDVSGRQAPPLLAVAEHQLAFDPGRIARIQARVSAGVRPATAPQFVGHVVPFIPPGPAAAREAREARRRVSAMRDEYSGDPDRARKLAHWATAFVRGRARGIYSEAAPVMEARARGSGVPECQCADCIAFRNGGARPGLHRGTGPP